MKFDIRKYETPYKYGKPVVEGSGKEGAFDCCSVDIPFVFFHNHKFHMMYTGFDGIGYQTALAESEDLVNWLCKGVILRRNDEKRWDSTSLSGTWIVKESNDLYDLPVLKKIDGRYWMVYHSYPGEGYEAGPAQIGLAYTEDENLLDWHRLKEPVFSWKDGRRWEAGGLYKACLIQEDSGYYLYYNAKTPDKDWVEQTGVAFTHDMKSFARYDNNPVLPVGNGGWDWKFLSDPCVVKDKDLWLNFYFAYDLQHAQEGIAWSDDKFRWHKYEKPIIPHGKKGELDEIHAHKASLIYHEGVLYHFYCAVRPYQEGDASQIYGEYRTITFASSKPVKITKNDK